MSYPYGQRRDDWSQGQPPPFPPPKFPPSPTARGPAQGDAAATLLQNVSMLAAQLQPSQQTNAGNQNDAAAKAFQLLQQIQQQQQQQQQQQLSTPSRAYDPPAQQYTSSSSSSSSGSSYQAPRQRYDSAPAPPSAAAWGARYATSSAPPASGSGSGGVSSGSSADRYGTSSKSRYDTAAPRYDTGARYEAPPARYAPSAPPKRYETPTSYRGGRGSYDGPKRYDDYKGGQNRGRYKSPPRSGRRDKPPRADKEKKRGLPPAPKFTNLPQQSEPAKRKTPLQKAPMVAPPVNILQRDRDCHNVIFRYPKLVVPKSFSHVVCDWIDAASLSITHPVSFMCSMRTTNPTDLKCPSLPSGTVRYYGKVMLFSGISQERLRNQDRRASTRLNSELRFIVGKKDRTELFPVGGEWSEVDGGDPSVDRSALIRTAVRHLLEFTSVDLSHCTEWLKFMELHYDRDGFKEVTVIFVPKLWTIPALPVLDSGVAAVDQEDLPSDDADAAPASADSNAGAPESADVEMEDATPKEHAAPEMKPAEETTVEDAETAGDEKAASRAEEEARPAANEEKPEAVPLAQTVTSETDTVTLIAAVPKGVKLKVMSLTLNGLLEYDETDHFEQTFEVSLFAELFQEMLQREFGDMVLKAMVRFSNARQELVRLPTERPPPAKKARIEEVPTQVPVPEENATGDSGAGDVDGEAMDIDSVSGDAQGTKGENLGGAIDGAHAGAPSVDGARVDGESVDGDAVDGEAVDGEPAAGEPTDGEAVDGEAVDGEAVDGEAVDDEAVDGEAVDGEAVDGEGVGGDPVDREAANIDGVAMSDTTETPEVDLLLLRAFEYFDRNDAGFLQPDRLEKVVYSLGKHLSRKTVEDLVDKLIDVESGNILFRKMIEAGQLSRK